MDYLKAAELSAAGLLAQKARIEAAAANIANMHTARVQGGAGYQPVTAVIRARSAGFDHLLRAEPAAALRLDPSSSALRPVRAEIVTQSGLSDRRAYEPGHPDADENGMVSYPAVDQAREMLTVMTAMRLYEANLAALQASRTLAARALDIGGQG